MNNQRLIICAGCLQKFKAVDTVFYRNKRCCSNKDCIDVIDKKVTKFNWKKQQKKIANGTYRNGVPLAIKQDIYKRDINCVNCNCEFEEYKMQVHHINPVSNDGNDDLENLILLCKDCHTNVHKEGYEKYYGKFRQYIENLGKISV